MAIRFQGAPVPPEVILRGGRWSGAYPLRTRRVEALRAARGVDVHHATLNRWGLTSSPPREDAVHPRQRPGWSRGRREETARQVQGAWPSRARAVDQYGAPMACLRTDHGATEAA